ncbi:heavy metal transporter [Streptomyces sp. NBC_01283]|uniref:heavy metal transporter n=1 Tax=Streptomyces sp. NBC_01283 TaxID=2903812 RepID=UPI00352D9F28|nr:heavy metal transporter [Streptomyces sp. NBC_01283]
MPEPPTLVRRGRLLRIGAAVAVLLALVAYVVVQYVFGGKAAPRCQVVSGNGDGASYEFGAEQAQNAATVAAVGTSRGMPERAITIALATALQESGLRNISHGDRDSLGLFQQRPSQGWGNEKQIMDPAYSAARFYAHLKDVPGYSRLPLTVAAQRVQRSGYPQAYAKHEPDAALLAAALTGRAPATLTCEARTADEPGDPAKVRAALVRDFGRGVAPESARGSTLTVPVSATAGTAEGGSGQRGWELAHWAVAQAATLGIERVSYGGREWSATDSGQEWRKPGKSGKGEPRAGAGTGTDEVRIVVGQ